jgi:hypothetical protein
VAPIGRAEKLRVGVAVGHILAGWQDIEGDAQSRLAAAGERAEDAASAAAAVANIGLSGAAHTLRGIGIAQQAL